MCGLFGWIGRLTGTERQALAWTLAIAADNRGGQSWGAAYWRSGWQVRRGLGRMAPDAPWCAAQSVLMAHTRLGTCGAVCIEHAHPFERCGAGAHIALAHNGMLDNVDTPVDSMALADRLAEGQDFKGIAGYGTISWVDWGRPQEISLCALTERAELAVAHVDTRAVVWSSTATDLARALETARVSARMYAIQPRRVYLARGEGLWRSGRELQLDPRTMDTDWKHWQQWWKKEQTDTEKDWTTDDELWRLEQ